MNEPWIDAAQRRFGAPPSAERWADDNLLTGIPFLTFELGRIVKADFWRLSVGVTAAAMTILLCFYWRNPRRIVSCFVPICLGLVYLMGVMSVTGMELNYVNTLAVPILIGLSVDNGIHLTERFVHDRGGIRGMIADTGRAIVVTGLTSMVGFGSLALVGVAWQVLAAWGLLIGVILFAAMRLSRRAVDERRKGRVAGVAAGLIAALSIALWWGWGSGGGIQGLGVLMILGMTTLLAASLVVMPALLTRFGQSLVPASPPPLDPDDVGVVSDTP